MHTKKPLTLFKQEDLKKAIIEFSNQWDHKLSFNQNWMTIQAFREAIADWLFSCQDHHRKVGHYRVTDAWESKNRPCCHVIIEQFTIKTLIEIKFDKSLYEKKIMKKFQASQKQLEIEEKKSVKEFTFSPLHKNLRFPRKKLKPIIEESQRDIVPAAQSTPSAQDKSTVFSLALDDDISIHLEMEQIDNSLDILLCP